MRMISFRKGPNMTARLPHLFACLMVVLLSVPAVAVDPDDKEIEHLVKQLGSNKFKEREQATKELNRIGKPALTALRKAATESRDREVISRATALIQAIENSLIRALDLKPHFNQKLNQPFHDSFQGNDLAALPTGPQTFADVKFFVGDGVVQLGSPRHPGGLAKAEGIKVGTKISKLHFLHSCGRSAGTPAGTHIGKYLLHYDDNSSAEVEIVYGKDVVDWWEQPGVADPTRGKVAWEGQNGMMRTSGLKIKLFLTTWENPQPNRVIRTIDYVMTGNRQQTGAAPFCVAISAAE